MTEITRIKELQEKYCFRIATQRGEKGLIPQLNASSLKGKIVDEIKAAKWEIIDYLEKRDEQRKIEKEQRKEEEKQSDIKKVEELKKSGNLIYFLKLHCGEYETTITLETGYHNFDYAKERNYKLEYCENMLFSNNATEQIELKKLYPKDIEKTEKKFAIGTADTYFILSEKEWQRLEKLEKEKINEEIEQRKIKKNEKEEKIKIIFEKAKKTNEKQLLERFPIDCQDPEESCDIDIVTIYAMPDGTKKQVVSHTW